MTHVDSERPDLDELEWTAEHRSTSLSRVFDHAVGLATGAEVWYAMKRGAKRRWGRALRVGVIVLGAAAAVLPIIAQITASDGDPSIPPGWAAVALALAAALVALDRYFGFSTGWMRFMAAELEITRLRHAFEYAWQSRRAATAAPPSGPEVAALLTLARDFVDAVDKVMADETARWTTEFRTALERADRDHGRLDRQ